MNREKWTDQYDTNLGQRSEQVDWGEETLVHETEFENTLCKS